MKKILVTGLCTLHWGRLQYGNIGNYYIVEPFFRLLHRYFPNYKIVTTFQMDDEFVRKEKIEVLPMNIYYAWDKKNDYKYAIKDYEVAKKISNGEKCEVITPYVKEVLESEIVFDISGDMWGDNAEHVGEKRFEIDCLKMKTAQLLNKKTILYAVTPGPFSDKKIYDLAKDVFEHFSLVVIREKISKNNLIKWGFSTENTVWAPCPSFLFEADASYRSKWTDYIEWNHLKGKKVVGITFGGFNMPVGPYDVWPRNEEQYSAFVELAEHIINELGACLLIFSHTNGFDLPPYFKLKNGRDYMILNQFYEILLKSEKCNLKNNICLIDEPLLPKEIKNVIGRLDMLITGRVHASVAATSQCVPTVFVEYDNNVIYSDKMTGFSSQLKMEKFVCKPGDANKLMEVTDNCFFNLNKVHSDLENIIPIIKKKSEKIFYEFK